MSERITVTGVIISTMAVGEYDRRFVMLTRERGKIHGFARGARRVNSPLLAAVNPFVFGSFSLYEGRNSYTMVQANVSHYFTELASVQPGVYYGFYFLELADYYARENTDERQMMNLLFVTLKAILHAKIDNDLIRRIFELKTLVLQGEYPQMFSCCLCGTEENLRYYAGRENGVICSSCAGHVPHPLKMENGFLYTMQYIISAPLEKLYTFTVKPNVQRQLDEVVGGWMKFHMDKKLKSLDILEMMKE